MIFSDDQLDFLWENFRSTDECEFLITQGSYAAVALHFHKWVNRYSKGLNIKSNPQVIG